MHRSRMLRNQLRKTHQRRAEQQITPVIVNAPNSAGSGGGEFHDTSGFHERDPERPPAIGFTSDLWLDRS